MFNSVLKFIPDLRPCKEIEAFVSLGRYSELVRSPQWSVPRIQPKLCCSPSTTSKEPIRSLVSRGICAATCLTCGSRWWYLHAGLRLFNLRDYPILRTADWSMCPFDHVSELNIPSPDVELCKGLDFRPRLVLDSEAGSWMIRFVKARPVGKSDTIMSSSRLHISLGNKQYSLERDS